MDLYEYISGSPVNAVDPTGNLEWSHKVESGPDLEGEFGFEIKILQTLSNRPALTAAAGAQSWQTNDVRTFALVSNATTCDWKRPTTRRLDVNDIGGKRTPIQITDTIGVKQDPDMPASFCVFVQVVRKRLGLRPFSVGDDGSIQFSTDPLPPGNNYEATDEQWTLAQRMAANPILSAVVTYVFFERLNCACCTAEQKQEAGNLLRRIFGSGTDPSVGTFEYLSYGDLGSWYAAGGLGSP